jgi:hypothetical protein
MKLEQLGSLSPEPRLHDPYSMQTLTREIKCKTSKLDGNFHQEFKLGEK